MFVPVGVVLTGTCGWDMDQTVEAFMDPKIYLFFLFGFTANVPTVGLHLFYAIPC
jgi:hypothetical protein